MSVPHVGIWWDDGVIVAALTHTPTDNITRGAGRVDSNLSHADEWPRVVALFGYRADDEYYNVPRGRVLWDARNQRGIILHGASTNRDRLELVAARFHLADQWTTEQHLHYHTGADVDDLFDDEL